jgi:hypothetical protein
MSVVKPLRDHEKNSFVFKKALADFFMENLGHFNNLLKAKLLVSVC